jgi:ADP-ribosylglycohydrolase
LRGQHPTFAPIPTKIRLSTLSTAVVDALGFANEFQRRFNVDFLSEMKANRYFSFIPAGSWTDDTSMMLCLAQSIAAVGGCDGADQMKRYARWRDEGYLSSVGHCFDVGVQIGRAIGIFSSFEEDHDAAFSQIKNELGEERNSGNGSLMRILPVGLVCWRDVDRGKAWARECSQTTHPNTMCVEACQLWTCLIMRILQEMDRMQQHEGERTWALSKLDLLEEINKFPFTDSKLREALTVPDTRDEETWFYQHHPLLRLISTTQTPNASTPPTDPSFPYTIPLVKSLSSSGYVLNTIVAALYCFFATRTFEEGALMAVNLCDDADTVGAVYAGLAGCWYAGEKGSEDAERLFWSKRVVQWMEAMKAKELVEQVAEELVIYESK